MPSTHLSRMHRNFRAAFATLALLSATVAGQAQTSPTRHVHEAVSSGGATRLGRMQSTQTLRLHVTLPTRDQAGLDQFLKDVADPASASYRQFLSPDEFAARFAPSQADYDAASLFFAENGFNIVGGSRAGMDIQVEGRVSVIERAFSISMGLYQHPTENRTFYSPDREPSAPIALWHVSGLDNFSTPQPLLVNRSEYASAHGIEPKAVVSHATTGSGPSASYLGSDMRAAYYGSGPLTGAGQNLGLFEFSGTDLADLTTYYTNIGQTNKVPVTQLSVDGTSTTCLNSGTHKCDDIEQTLDLTQSLGMAPGLASLVMYVGSSDTAIMSAMTTHSPLPMTIGCSWGWTPADATTLNPFLQRMAAQGQSFFTASGDNSTWTKTGKSEAWPADNAYVIAVGGTDLVTSGANGAWASETAWADSGGGISPDGIPIPSWQAQAGVITSSNKGSTTLRNGPDVAANANFTFYVCGNQTACTANQYGGTSFAAPMWAGYAALANQQAAAVGKPPIGFFNPALYSMGLFSTYPIAMHDITSGTSGSYSAVAGFDLVTGWGSPNGAGLINALVNLPVAPNFSLTASPATASIAPGGHTISTITTTLTGNFNSSIALTAAGQPSGVTVSFSPAAIAAPGSGTSTMTVTAGASVVAGTYPITITATGSNTTHTATFSLVVTPPPAFAITALPATVSIAKGGKGTAVIATTVTGGFSAAVALAAAGAPAGVTAALSAASIAAPGAGSVTLTISVASTVANGTYPITITASSGGVSHTAIVNVNVTAPAGFALSAAPASLTVARGGSGSSTITATITGNFNSDISVPDSGSPQGVKATFGRSTGDSIPLNFTVASATAVGTYPITVTGTGGGLTETVTVSLTVK